jgi:hypothetical protein
MPSSSSLLFNFNRLWLFTWHLKINNYKQFPVCSSRGTGKIKFKQMNQEKRLLILLMIGKQWKGKRLSTTIIDDQFDLFEYPRVFLCCFLKIDHNSITWHVSSMLIISKWKPNLFEWKNNSEVRILLFFRNRQIDNASIDNHINRISFDAFHWPWNVNVFPNEHWLSYSRILRYSFWLHPINKTNV